MNVCIPLDSHAEILTPKCDGVRSWGWKVISSSGWSRATFGANLNRILKKDPRELCSLPSASWEYRKKLALYNPTLPDKQPINKRIIREVIYRSSPYESRGPSTSLIPQTWRCWAWAPRTSGFKIQQGLHNERARGLQESKTSLLKSPWKVSYTWKPSMQEV